MSVSTVLVEADEERRAQVFTIVTSDPDFRIVGEAGAVRAAIVAVARLQPDLVLVAALPDVEEPPGLVGLLEAAQHSLLVLIGDHPTSNSDESPSNVFRLAAAEVDIRLTPLLRHIKRRMTEGSNEFAARVLARARPSRSALGTSLPSPRQMEVLQHLVSGQSHREIARALRISQSTVDRHVADLYMKLHVTTRAQAIARAAELAWVLSPEKLDQAESRGGTAHGEIGVREPSDRGR